MIRSAEQLLEALTVEKANIETYKVQLNFSSLDVTECNQDHSNLTTALDNQDISDAVGKGVTKVKNLVYNGKSTESVEPYPSLAITELPFPSVKAGALSRYLNRKARAKLASGYTQQIGLAMGYVDTPPEPVQPDNLTAALKRYTDMGNYSISAAFQKQGMSGMLFQYRIKGTEKWFDIKTALTSPVLINFPQPSVEGAVLEIEVRVRLIEGNTPVGHWSPIYLMNLTA